MESRGCVHVELLFRKSHPAGKHRQPQRQQQVAEDRTGQRGLDDLISPFLSANTPMISSGALPIDAFSSPPSVGPR